MSTLFPKFKSSAPLQAGLYYARKRSRLLRIAASEQNAAPVSSTFNPSDINADITLSNGNLTATGKNSSNGGARGKTFHSSGKFMLTFTNVTLSDGLDYIGIGTAADTLGLANGAQDQVILITGGTSFSGTGSAANNFPDFAGVPADATVDLCVDLTGQLFWFRINGGEWNNSGTANPATGVGGHAISANGAKTPYVRLTNTAATCTLNTVPNDAPSGFSMWE